MLDFEQVVVKPELFKGLNREQMIERETRMKQIEADREAYRVRKIKTAEAEAEAERVAAMIRSLRDEGVELPPEVVISAIRGSDSSILEGDFIPLSSGVEANSAQKPADEKKNDKKP
jgi:hypothetical protein